MRWLTRWLRRHRLLTLLALGLAGARVAWLRARGGRAAGPKREAAAERAGGAETPETAPPEGVGVVPGPYPGSARPLADGSAPSPEHTVKAKLATMRCHGPSSPYFGRTKADVWFRTEQDAAAAGFRVWSRRR